MRRLGLHGVRRGKPVRTTVPDTTTPCPLGHVNRQFKAGRPNQLWVSDFTYVSTWQGFIYIVFVIDVFSRRIVGWRVFRSMRTDFVLDALKQELYRARWRTGPSFGSRVAAVRVTQWLLTRIAGEAAMLDALWAPS